ncbi:MAG: TIGR02266 family protein [Deltaproteobacteria bacterium]|nr:TIGR02266 family protein [Deltaproteobacteria bacterium]
MADTKTPSTTTNRRRYPRVPLSLLVQYKFNSLEEFISEYALNISLGGMFIKTTEPREKGILIYFQFTLADGSKLIEGLGRVVWVNKVDVNNPDKVPGMGIEFINMDEESMQLIEEIVNNNLKKGNVLPETPP